MNLTNKLILIGERFHLDLVFYVLVSLLILVEYYSFIFYKALGFLILVLGFSIWILGLYTLGDSFQVRAKAKVLVTSGIYSKIRHPIYFGGFLIELGILIYTFHTLLFWFILIYTLILNIVQFLRITKEEKILQDRFGRKYLRYKAKTFF